MKQSLYNQAYIYLAFIYNIQNLLFSQKPYLCIIYNSIDGAPLFTMQFRLPQRGRVNGGFTVHDADHLFYMSTYHVKAVDKFDKQFL